MPKISKKQGYTLETLKIFLLENLRFKRLFFATIALWTSGILIQKLLLPLIIAKAIDKIISLEDVTDLEWGQFGTELILFVIVILTAQLAIDVGLVLLSRMETKVMPQLHIRIYNHLISQSAKFHANSFAGSLVTQTNRFVNAYQALTDTIILNITQIFILTVLSSVVVAFYVPVLGLMIITWTLLFMSLNYVLTKKRIGLAKSVAAADTKMTGYLADSIGNIGTIRAFAKEYDEEKQFSGLANDKASKKYKYWIRAIKNDALFGILMGTLQILVLVISIYLIRSGVMTVGSFVLVQVYITQIIGSLWGLSSIMRNIEQNLSDAVEMTSILNIKPEIVDNSDTDLVANRGEIKFDKVSFSHADSKDPLFKGLSLKIKQGEKIGLVGASGGGKTTLTKLLLRFSDIDEGTITIDGQDISKVTQKSLREQITYVPQEPLLFHRSLAENISYSNPEASTEEIIAISKLANADEFIDKIPTGYKTQVGERGVKLSGGQRQRIAIARAMLKNAPILVLDEATSALDSESEALIQDALWRLMENRTAIIIAHRLSTIQQMDRIIVMDNGKILEQGTHRELLSKKGVYAKLWHRQSGGFLED